MLVSKFQHNLEISQAYRNSFIELINRTIRSICHNKVIDEYNFENVRNSYYTIVRSFLDQLSNGQALHEEYLDSVQRKVFHDAITPVENAYIDFLKRANGLPRPDKWKVYDCTNDVNDLRLWYRKFKIERRVKDYLQYFRDECLDLVRDFTEDKIDHNIFVNLEKLKNDTSNYLRTYIRDYSEKTGDIRIIHYSDLLISKSSDIIGKEFKKAKDFIGSFINSDNNYSSIDERLEELEQFAKENQGEGVAAFARSLFPEFYRLEAEDKMRWGNRVSESQRGTVAGLPSEAPIIWSIANRLTLDDGNGGQRRETSPEFIRRVYGEWLGRGMTRSHLRQLDRTLSQDLDRYTSANGMPDDLIRDLPRVKDLGDVAARRWETGLNPDGSEALFTKAEAQRAATAAYSRRDKT